MSNPGPSEPARDARAPLAGMRVLVTRAAAQAQAMVDALAAAGAEAVLLPLLEIAPPEDPAPLEAAVARLDAYAWVIFTSANAVRAVTGRLQAAGRDARAFGAARVCAIGPATAAALAAAGVRVDLVPAEHVGEGVVAAFAEAGPLAGQRVLLPRAAAARDLIPEELRRRGAQVDAVVAYRNLRPEVDPAPVLAELRRGTIDVVTFASPSAVHGFVALCGGPAEAAVMLARARVAVIGPKTRQAALEHGLTVHVMPAEYSVPALVAALGQGAQGGV
jgi:uroporphyrinogen-III synthase